MDEIREGTEKKGGRNGPPTGERPLSPAGQGLAMAFAAARMSEARDRELSELREYAVELFNRFVPCGTDVLVTLDNGVKKPSTTRSAAWSMGGEHPPLVMLEGVSGGYKVTCFPYADLE